MPKVSWFEFIYHRPNAHLLVVSLAEREAPYNARRHFNLMARFLDRFAKGQYALTIHRRAPSPEIHCLFDREDDARRIGDRLGARDFVGYPQRLTRRCFSLTGSIRKTINDALKAA